MVVGGKHCIEGHHQLQPRHVFDHTKCIMLIVTQLLLNKRPAFVMLNQVLQVMTPQDTHEFTQDKQQHVKGTDSD